MPTLRITLLILCLSFSNFSFADKEKKKSSDDDDPCAGDYAILSIVNRPTVADSACVMKPGQSMFETGYQSLLLLTSERGYNFPELQYRYGIGKETELSIIAPNYIHQPDPGLGPTTIGFKHRFKYTKNWVLTGEILITPPTGSNNNGNSDTGYAINGIYSLNLTDTIALDTMFGVSSQTLSNADGGGRYNSFNPDFIFSWQPIKRILLYYEIYGETRTSPTSGAGFNEDIGITYALTQNWEVDASFGNNISGDLGGFKNYWGIGTAFSI